MNRAKPTNPVDYFRVARHSGAIPGDDRLTCDSSGPYPNPNEKADSAQGATHTWRHVDPSETGPCSYHCSLQIILLVFFESAGVHSHESGNLAGTLSTPGSNPLWQVSSSVFSDRSIHRSHPRFTPLLHQGSLGRIRTHRPREKHASAHPARRTLKARNPESARARPAAANPPSAEAQARSLWAEFEKSSWGAPLQDWSSLHPDIPCAAFRGDLLGSADRQWSQRCSASREREAAHWSFYVFGLQEPLISRLEQFDVTTGALAEQTLAAVQSALQTRLTVRYGPAEDRSRKYSVPAVPWPVRVHWQAADLEIQLDLTEFDPSRKEGRLSLQGCHRALLDALDDDQRLNKVGGVSNSLYQAGSPMNGQLADNLRPDFPDVAVMLTKYQPDPDPQTREADQQKMREAVQKQLQSQVKAAQTAGQAGPRAFIVAGQQTITNWKAEQFRDALMRVLTAARNSSPDRQPVLLLAADYLARRLPSVMTNDKSQAGHWGEWRTELAALGVMYEESATSPDEYRYRPTPLLLHRLGLTSAKRQWVAVYCGFERPRIQV